MDNNIRPLREGQRPKGLLGKIFRSAVFMLGTVAVLLLLTLLGAIMLNNLAVTGDFTERILRFRLYGHVIQLSVVVCLWIFWNNIIRFFVGRRLISQYVEIFLLSRRHLWAAVIVIFQLWMIFTIVQTR